MSTARRLKDTFRRTGLGRRRKPPDQIQVQVSTRPGFRKEPGFFMPARRPAPKP